MFKALIYITNFTDSFKIIDPKDIKIKTSNGNEYALLNKNQLVIAPKGSEKFRLKFEGPGLKSQHLTLSIANVQTTGPAISVYNFGKIELNKKFLASIKDRQFTHQQVGPMDICIKDFQYKANGTAMVKFSVKYNSPNFLGFFLKNIMLIDSGGKSQPNKKLGVHYYRKEKKEVVIVAAFNNPYGTSEEIRTDKLLLENVFVEYVPKTNSEANLFTLTKKGEGKGNPSKDEKDNDIEVIED